MPKFSGKTMKTSSDSKRHFTVVMGNKEHGLYISSTPSSAAKKAVTKLCGSNKSKKVEFHIREITQGSKKKVYGPYVGYIQKLPKPIQLKSRIIENMPIVHLKKKSIIKKGGMKGGEGIDDIIISVGDCGRDGLQNLFKKCIVLSYNNRKITIIYDDIRQIIVVKYFNNIGNNYYEKREYNVKKTSVWEFYEIISELIDNLELVNSFKIPDLIEKIKEYIDEIHDADLPFLMINTWLDRIVPKAKHLNITNVPFVVQMNDPEIKIEQPRIQENERSRLNRVQRAKEEERQRLYQVMQSLPGSSEELNPRLMYRTNFSKQLSRLNTGVNPGVNKRNNNSKHPY